MGQITKEKVIAEIKELYNDIDKCISDLIAARGKHDGNGISNAHWRMETLMVNTQQAICNVVDTLEVKKVDLDKEVTLYIQSNTRNGYFRADIHDVAKHFYELGINSKK